MEPNLVYLYQDDNEIEEDHKITTSMLRKVFTPEPKAQAKVRVEIYNVNHHEDIVEDIEDIVEKNCSYLGGKEQEYR